MAGVLRISLRGVAAGNKTTAILPALQQKCNISSKSMRGSQKLVKPAPYPYKTKGYGFLNALFDSTPSRFDENTKVRQAMTIIDTVLHIIARIPSLAGDCCRWTDGVGQDRLGQGAGR